MNIYEIPGKPIAWKRARRSGNRYFDSQIKEKEAMQRTILLSGKAVYSFAEPLKVTMEFDMPIPKSWSRVRRLNAIGSPHKVTPDCDNLIKMICDTFNGILWRDDAVIYELKARKCYAEEPKTRIFVELYDKKPMHSISSS